MPISVGMVAEKAGNENASGFRPAVVYSQGDLTLRAGLEALQNNAVIPGADSTGVGLSVGYALADRSRQVHCIISDGECAEEIGRASCRERVSSPV